jgi:deoxyribose-phosphate aldolase
MNATDTSEIATEIQGIRAVVARFAPQTGQEMPAADWGKPPSSLAATIDHTLLRPDAKRSDVQRACEEARQYGFATVCLNSQWITEASRWLAGSSTVPIAVVGFPLGAMSSAAKAFETRQAVADGAREIDMVLQIGPLKDQDLPAVYADILAVVEAARPWPVKVILETSALSWSQKIAGCILSQMAGAAFVKTSTGFGGGGATADDIALMRKVVGPRMGVKASGGIRTHEDAQRMIAAGANRIGASSSIAIVTRGKGGAAGAY